MLFLDCEFDGFGGRLISMALVSTDGDEFYEVLPYFHHSDLNPWVVANVLPKLDKASITALEFRDKLHVFLQKHIGEVIVADSPADFKYLMDQIEWMADGNKYRYLNLSITMQFTPSGEYTPDNPHNALSDAKALMKWYLEHEKKHD